MLKSPAPPPAGRSRGLPGSCRFSCYRPCSLAPAGHHRSRRTLEARASPAGGAINSFCIGFRFPDHVATCLCSNEAESPQKGASLIPAHRIHWVQFGWAVQRFAYPSQSCNTWCGWLAKPYPMETFTPHWEPAFFAPKYVKSMLVCQSYCQYSMLHRVSTMVSRFEDGLNGWDVIFRYCSESFVGIYGTDGQDYLLLPPYYLSVSQDINILDAEHFGAWISKR